MTLVLFIFSPGLGGEVIDRRHDLGLGLGGKRLRRTVGQGPPYGISSTPTDPQGKIDPDCLQVNK